MGNTSAWYRRQALERAGRLREQLGGKKPWERSGTRTAEPHPQAGARVPYLARAHWREDYFRCRLAVAIETGEANQQAVARVACGGLVFGKALQQHLLDVHGLEVAVDQVHEYFHQVDSHQGGGE